MGSTFLTKVQKVGDIEKGLRKQSSLKKKAQDEDEDSLKSEILEYIQEVGRVDDNDLESVFGDNYDLEEISNAVDALVNEGQVGYEAIEESEGSGMGVYFASKKTKQATIPQERFFFRHKPERNFGQPKSDVERVMNHYQVSEEDAEKMIEATPIEELLPERGTGLKESSRIKRAQDEEDEVEEEKWYVANFSVSSGMPDFINAEWFDTFEQVISHLQSVAKDLESGEEYTIGKGTPGISDWAPPA